MSSGNGKKARIAREAKRQAKFAAKREAGTAYKWQPNPYKKGSDDWVAEEGARREKRWANSRTDVAIFTSIMAKLDNQIAKAQAENKERKASQPKRNKTED